MAEKMGTSGSQSAVLKFGSQRTSDDVISVTIESGMVENVVVAVGISLLSYSVTEIHSTSGVMTAILFYASHLMSAKMRNHSNKLTPALSDRFSTKPSSRPTYTHYTSLEDIRLLDAAFDKHRLVRLFPAAVLFYFQLLRTFPYMDKANRVTHSGNHENVW